MCMCTRPRLDADHLRDVPATAEKPRSRSWGAIDTRRAGLSDRGLPPPPSLDNTGVITCARYVLAVISPSSIFRTRPPVDPATADVYNIPMNIILPAVFLRTHTHTYVVAVRTITVVYVVGVTNTGSRLECTPIHRPRLALRTRARVCMYKPLRSAWPMMTCVFLFIICFFFFRVLYIPHAERRRTSESTHSRIPIINSFLPFPPPPSTTPLMVLEKKIQKIRTICGS